MALKIRTLIGIGLLLSFGLALAADPPYYTRKETWQETLRASREALAKAEDEAARQQGAPAPGGVQLGPWYSIGPFLRKGPSAFDDVFPPEEEVDLAKEYDKLRWVKHPEWQDGVVHDLPGSAELDTYLTRTITATAATTVTGYFGSDDGLVVWLNGKKLISNKVPRGAGPNQDTAELALAAGENRLLLKIWNQGGGHGYYFSLSPTPSPADPRADKRGELWSLVERDFTQPADRRQMAWERQEGIWTGDWPAGDFRALAKRYVEGTRVAFLKAEAQKLAGGSPPNPPAGGGAALLAALGQVFGRSRAIEEQSAAMRSFDPQALRLAVEDLTQSFGKRYPNGAAYLKRLDALEERRQAALAGAAKGDAAGVEALAKVGEEIDALRREALLANPLIDFDRLLVVKRGMGRLGLPQNWQGNSSVGGTGYDNEIDTLSLPDGKLTPLYRPAGGKFVGDICLHFDGEKMLVSMPGSNGRWQVHEMSVDGSTLREVTPTDQPEIDNFNGCYLPNGKIIYCSTACWQGVPCVGGSDHVSLLYLLDPATKKVRQLTFDQDHSWYPTVLNDGRVLYTRWEYSDTPHYFSRLLFSMNPDGTDQKEYYGSDSYWPNSTFYARPIPGDPAKVVGIVSGHHGVPRMGELVVFDPGKARQEGSGVVCRIPGRGKKVEPVITDQLVQESWPKFLHPYPLSDKYFLVSCQPDENAPWGVYLVDRFDNMVKIAALDGYALFEPTPLRKRPTPPVVPDRVTPGVREARVYMQDVYAGGGLKGVPRGTIKALRVYSDHYAYVGMGGHINVGIDGPWDVKRIIGTVPVKPDGSAFFTVPANTPLAVEPLDAEGKAVQVMRSWMTAMPGETLSCVGCHESQNSAPTLTGSAAGRQQPDEITPWRGPARGFSFEREVQPVLTRYCVSCHNGQPRPDGKSIPDLRAKEQVPGYTGAFTPAYEQLHRFVHRPGNESDYHLPVPYEYHADTSELVQMLKKGHHGVKLDAEAWDRIITWIDLNVPCYGTWHEQRPIPADGQARRVLLRSLYAGMEDDPEVIPQAPAADVKPEPPPVEPARAAQPVSLPGWPMDAADAKSRQAAAGPAAERKIDLGGGVSLEMVLVPAGEFVMGDAAGAPDEQPLAPVRVEKPFWMGRLEITNEQYALFDPAHDSRFADFLNKDHSSPGYPLNGPRQPVIRVSWKEAMAFCRWLFEKTGEPFTLPTEAQWEYACRAGTGTPFYFGGVGSDFSKFANMADATLSGYYRGNSPDWIPKEDRFRDGAMVTVEGGRFQPNAWGLCDMLGNAAEWTRSRYAPYPYRTDDGRDDGAEAGRKVVRGGSWHDRPERCRAGFRLSYYPWQPVYDVGFRVVCDAK